MEQNLAFLPVPLELYLLLNIRPGDTLEYCAYTDGSVTIKNMSTESKNCIILCDEDCEECQYFNEWDEVCEVEE